MSRYMPLSERGRLTALAVKLAASVAGVGMAVFASAYLLAEVRYVSLRGAFSYVDMILMVTAVSVLFSGITLTALLPESLRRRLWRPWRRPQTEPVYGLGTVLAVGVGSTLGSPLFVLIPENMIRYSLLSVGSLLLAAGITFLVAKLYSDMYAAARGMGRDAVGGAAFPRIAWGSKSLRYFVARVTKWLANTALAAYSAIIFVIFDVRELTPILSDVGLTGRAADALVLAIAALFVGWFALNTIFEKRFLRLIGRIQIVLTSVMIVILVYQSYALGGTSGWDLSGLLRQTFTGDWPLALAVNTAYIYLLFFGFEEVQSLDREARPESTLPVLSWFGVRRTVNKSSYFRTAMIGSVLVALVVNITYALAVFASHPNAQAVLSSTIPALYLTRTFLGAQQELLMSVAFLIASFTTFVPAFMAASRHLGSLGEDGFMPQTVSEMAWLFTVIFVLLLAVINRDLLINITDFMVLVSLGFTVMAAVWLRKPKLLPVQWADVMPLGTATICFVVGGMMYLISPLVAVLGAVSLAVVYLIYDVMELGALGNQVFLLVFDAVSFLSLASLSSPSRDQEYVLPLAQITWQTADNALVVGLALASVLLLLNVLVDVKVLHRTPISRRP
ncbi:MAG: APC family permease [Nitrososphaerota archaeon]|nr:APC family permease [Nitrososphaerota archaeon]